MMLRAGDIVFCRNAGIISKLIRWRTLGRWSHVGIIAGFVQGKVGHVPIVLSAQGKGITDEPLYEWPKDKAFLRVRDITDTQVDAALDFADLQRGKPYDFCGLVDFLTFRKHQREDRWFCSELVFAALRHAGIDLFGGRKDKAFVSPGDIYENPLLEQVKEV
jgi:uncharacterized protein YycO